MRLKSVELYGFKSFPDRTTIEFGKGITAILGPNGCGKSNVVDAIKWVLGETSAKNLRGEEMLDVIFSGCEARSASAMAEVKLNFDNTDQNLPLPYNEVSIARRIYRSKESEYFINQNRCRRRDIRDLFLDTGIGGSAYSVIEQGRVEALLHAKPADRRAVFEEAAGIAKFKVRRKEILSRLERTEQVFLRVNDRVEDKERQIRRVGAQAANARRYRRLKEELDTLKTYLYRRQYAEQLKAVDSINAKRALLEAEIAAEDAKLAGAVAEIASLGALESELTANRDQAVEAVGKTQEELSQVQLDHTNTLNRLNTLKADISRSAERKSELSAQLARLTAIAAELAAELETAQQSEDALNQQVSQLDENRQALLANVETAEKEVNSLRNRVIDLTRKRHELDSNAAKIEASGQSAANRIADIEMRHSRLKEEEQTLAAAVTSLESEYQQAAEAYGRLADEVETARAGLAALSSESEALLREERALDSERSAKASRKATLEDLENSLAGAYEGVKNVITAAKQGDPACSGVIAMAFDLMTVPQEYALAMETILGGSAQDIVVHSARDAQTAIEYLKRNRLGRATFLPLDRIQPRRRLQQDFRRYPGVVGEAVDLVDFDPRYRVVMEYLLAGILIVDNLDLARELSGREARGVKIVTLEGDVINPAGSMTGGHGRQRAAGLVQRKAELDAVSAELAACEQQLSEKLARRREIDLGLQNRKNSIAEMEAKLAEAGRAETGLRQNIAVRKSELERVAKSRQEAEAESSALNASTGNWREELAALRAELAEADLEMARLEAETEAKTAIQRQAHADLESLGQNFASLSGERATAAALARELTRRIEETAEEKAGCETALAACADGGDTREAEIAHLDERLALLREKEEQLLVQRDQQKAASVELLERLAELRETLEVQRRIERDCQTQLSRIREGVTLLERQYSECSIRIDNLREKAREELGLEDLAQPAAEADEIAAPAQQTSDNLFAEESAGEETVSPAEPAPANPWDSESDADLQRQAESLAQKIKNIGPVNFEAIDELAELEAGAEFLRSQKEDLETAVNDMRQTIDKLNGESSTRFQEAFVKVRENFQQMFTRLFGGGKADLILEEVTDPEADPLEAGIDIRAQPPGKEPKSISLLSGGEKALCAVALLFALFRSRPSPFCILDEVDGPLDESNIDRFMQQVKDFTADTQFIIITHSQRTMGMTDEIWGVTQQVPGISTIHSLNFNAMGVISESSGPAADSSREKEEESVVSA